MRASSPIPISACLLGLALLAACGNSSPHAVDLPDAGPAVPDRWLADLPVDAHAEDRRQEADSPRFEEVSGDGAFEARGEDLPGVADTDSQDAPEADWTSQADTEVEDIGPPPLPEWTLIFYMNGDNSLSEEAEEDLAELAATPWSPDVNVVVLLDTLFGETEELVLGPDGFESLAPAQERDLGDWRELRDFGLRAIETRPAQRYALFLWNHGNGWRGEQATGSKSFSFDDHGVFQEISVAEGELTAALLPMVEAAGHPLDLVALDMCLMGMWEVAAAIGESGRVMVASEETEPASGWPYEAILSTLSQSPSSSAKSLAESIVSLYHEADNDNSTLAALNLEKLPALSAAVDQLGTELAALLPAGKAPLESARQSTQWFDDDFTSETSPYRDLYHFSQVLDETLTPTEGLQQATAAVRTALDQVVLLNLSQASHPKARGVAIHLPGSDRYYPPLYTAADAPWHDSGWAAFVAAFSTPSCATWTCSWSYFGADDGCDCGCGGWDPDCDKGKDIYGCAGNDVCVQPGLCQDNKGPCPDGESQCAGDQVLAHCEAGAWVETPCTELLSCPEEGPVGAAVCGWLPAEGAYGCACYDDPVLCADQECGDNGLGQWCGECNGTDVCLEGICIDKGNCPGIEVLDCDGLCADSDWLGDGYCDDGKWDVDFDCAALDWDAGDCL